MEDLAGFPFWAGERRISPPNFQWASENLPEPNGSLICISSRISKFAFDSNPLFIFPFSLTHQHIWFIQYSFHYYIVSIDLCIWGQAVRFDFNERVTISDKLLKLTRIVTIFKVNWLSFFFTFSHSHKKRKDSRCYLWYSLFLPVTSHSPIFKNPVCNFYLKSTLYFQP